MVRAGRVTLTRTLDIHSPGDSAHLERRLSAAREPAPIQPELDLAKPSSGLS
jgi:hypothetical protein